MDKIQQTYGPTIQESSMPEIEMGVPAKSSTTSHSGNGLHEYMQYAKPFITPIPLFNIATAPSVVRAIDSISQSVLSGFSSLGEWWGGAKGHSTTAITDSAGVLGIASEVNDEIDKRIPTSFEKPGFFQSAGKKALGIFNAGIGVLDAAEAYHRDPSGADFMKHTVKSVAQGMVTTTGASILAGGLVGGAAILSTPVLLGGAIAFGGGYLVGKAFDAFF